MKKYLTMVLFALFAFCGVAFAQETGAADPAAPARDDRHFIF